MKKFNLLMLIPILAGIFLTSCYYDYGIDSNNSDVIATFYNTDYNFQNVSTYYFADSVYHFEQEGNISRAYDNTIKSTIVSNLNSLGWQQVSDTSQADVVVATGVTTSTTTVIGGGGYWWGYWGYWWYYPPYYNYSYSYTTGTLAILMVDLKLKEADRIPLQWSAVSNGLLNTAQNTTSRITQNINQAFSQSPYLKKQ